MTDSALIVYCTHPDPAQAEVLAGRLVEEGLAACVNILPGLTSVYRWQGKLQSDAENLLLIKTRDSLFEALQARIQGLHPYELPEIIAVSVSQGLPSYLAWIVESTAPTP